MRLVLELGGIYEYNRPESVSVFSLSIADQTTDLLDYISAV